MLNALWSLHFFTVKDEIVWGLAIIKTDKTHSSEAHGQETTSHINKKDTSASYLRVGVALLFLLELCNLQWVCTVQHDYNKSFAVVFIYICYCAGIYKIVMYRCNYYLHESTRPIAC